MSSKIIYYVVLVFIFAGLFVCIIPVPFYNVGYDSLSEEEKKLYNDAYEIENNPYKDVQDYNEVINSIGNVVNLDWFDVVNNFFTKYTLTAKVIDVNTKKSYYVKRVGGYNHADVQPIDAENTAIMKSLYNGEWSWTRRPVWVEINGTYIAGSINGMPHGYTLIEGNNMDGHTCIHFLNSMTHGTKRVDEAHQNAIATAYQRRDELKKILLNN